MTCTPEALEVMRRMPWWVLAAFWAVALPGAAAVFWLVRRGRSILAALTAIVIVPSLFLARGIATIQYEDYYLACSGPYFSLESMGPALWTTYAAAEAGAIAMAACLLFAVVRWVRKRGNHAGA